MPILVRAQSVMWERRAADGRSCLKVGLSSIGPMDSMVMHSQTLLRDWTEHTGAAEAGRPQPFHAPGYDAMLDRCSARRLGAYKRGNTLNSFIFGDQTTMPHNSCTSRPCRRPIRSTYGCDLRDQTGEFPFAQADRLASGHAVLVVTFPRRQLVHHGRVQTLVSDIPEPRLAQCRPDTPAQEFNGHAHPLRAVCRRIAPEATLLIFHHWSEVNLVKYGAEHHRVDNVSRSNLFEPFPNRALTASRSLCRLLTAALSRTFALRAIQVE